MTASAGPTPATIDRAAILAIERLIRPHVRRTPVVEASAGDFGLDASVTLALKLELAQHAGSFEARGAFANRLPRALPPAGVAALAALLPGAYRPAPGERVGVIVCGGNTGAARRLLRPPPGAVASSAPTAGASPAAVHDTEAPLRTAVHSAAGPDTLRAPSR